MKTRFNVFCLATALFSIIAIFPTTFATGSEPKIKKLKATSPADFIGNYKLASSNDKPNSPEGCANEMSISIDENGTVIMSNSEHILSSSDLKGIQQDSVRIGSDTVEAGGWHFNYKYKVGSAFVDGQILKVDGSDPNYPHAKHTLTLTEEGVEFRYVDEAVWSAKLFRVRSYDNRCLYKRL